MCSVRFWNLAMHWLNVDEIDVFTTEHLPVGKEAVAYIQTQQSIMMACYLSGHDVVDHHYNIVAHPAGHVYIALAY